MAILQIYSKRDSQAIAAIDFYISDYYKDMRLVESNALRPSQETGARLGLQGEYFTATPRTDHGVNFVDSLDEHGPGLAAARRWQIARIILARWLC
ncbi:MAG: hypothetical protein ABGX16_22080, partial [Pirellulales bacterium]